MHDSKKAIHSLPLIFESYDACDKHIRENARYSWGYPRVADMRADGSQRFAPVLARGRPNPNHHARGRIQGRALDTVTRER